MRKVLSILFGTVKTLDKFIAKIKKCQSKEVVIRIEKKSKITLPETAQYFERITARSGSIKLRLPWKSAGGYYGMMPAEALLLKLKEDVQIAKTVHSKLLLEMNKIRDVLTKEGIRCEILE